MIFWLILPRGVARCFSHINQVDFLRFWTNWPIPPFLHPSSFHTSQMHGQKCVVKHFFYYNYTALVLICLINLDRFVFPYFFEKNGEGLSPIIYLMCYVWVSVVYDCMTLTHLRYQLVSDHNIIFVKIQWINQ